jgi:hypothetical protein
MDFGGLLIVPVGVDSPVEAVFVQGIEPSLKSLQVRFMASDCLLPRGLFGQMVNSQMFNRTSVQKAFHCTRLRQLSLVIVRKEKPPVATGRNVAHQDHRIYTSEL